MSIFEKELQVFPKLNKPYSKGSYNKYNSKEQWIRITEGCPNACAYCRETLENEKDPIYYDIPTIIRNDVKILDMNLIYKDRCLEILNYLGSLKVNNKVVKYELVCGIDYRYLTLEIAKALKDNRFINIRLAWDHSIKEQYKVKKALDYLIKVGYNPKNIMVFIICNYKVSFDDNMLKMDLCKVWGVKIGACWFDNQIKDIKPIYWTHAQIKEYNRKEKKHNQLINFRIDPEVRQ